MLRIQRRRDTAQKTDNFHRVLSIMVSEDSPERAGLSLIFTCESAKVLKLRPEGHKAAEQVKEMGIQSSKNGNGACKDLRVTECLVCTETTKHLEHRI